MTGSRSRLTISVDFTGHGIGKILVPLMVRREISQDREEHITRQAPSSRSPGSRCEGNPES